MSCEATPKTILGVDIHRAALKALPTEMSARRHYFIKEESRILLIEVLGYLLNFYRNRF